MSFLILELPGFVLRGLDVIILHQCEIMKYEGELLNKRPPGNLYKIVPDTRDVCEATRQRGCTPTAHENTPEHTDAQTFAD